MQTNLTGSFVSSPAPTATLIRGYSIGCEEPLFSFRAAPRLLTWPAKQRLMADYWQCEPDDIGSTELSDGTECITVYGNVVGSFDRAVALSELLAGSV